LVQTFVYFSYLVKADILLQFTINSLLRNILVGIYPVFKI